MKIIIVKSGGTEDSFQTTASTIGQLFASVEFVEDFSVPGGAVPTLDGVRATSSQAIVTGSVIGWERPVADKGAN